MNADESFMRRALALAAEAARQGEVPVGAVVVRQGEIVGEGYNCPISTSDPTAHAEVVAMRDAARRLGNYRLSDCDLYVTLEPCLMCCGALVHARIRRVVYGAKEPKAGSVHSQFAALDVAYLNVRIPVSGGVLAEDSAELLGAFFRTRRG